LGMVASNHIRTLTNLFFTDRSGKLAQHSRYLLYLRYPRRLLSTVTVAAVWSRPNRSWIQGFSSPDGSCSVGPSKG
jgi:hypothetical protein